MYPKLNGIKFYEDSPDDWCFLYELRDMHIDMYEQEIFTLTETAHFYMRLDSISHSEPYNTRSKEFWDSLIERCLEVRDAVDHQVVDRNDLFTLGEDRIMQLMDSIEKCLQSLMQKKEDFIEK